MAFCEVYYPKDADALELVSRTDGFADTVLHWEPARGDTIPTNYTLRLIRAAHIGGYVREEDGTPVPGARVKFLSSRAEAAALLAHENHLFKPIVIMADAEGRWSLDRIAPNVLGTTAGLVMEPDYLLSQVFPGNPAEEESLDLLREGRFVFKLSRGATLQGTVVDTQGNPVSGAKVVVRKAGESEHSQATTREDGWFAAKCCPTGETCVAVTAKAFAGKVLALNLEAEPAPLNIVLEPGRAVRLKVVDQSGPAGRRGRHLRLSVGIARIDARGGQQNRHQWKLGRAGALHRNYDDSGQGQWLFARRGGDCGRPSGRNGRVDQSNGHGAARRSHGRDHRPAHSSSFSVVYGFPSSGNPPTTNGSFEPSPMSDDWVKFGQGKFRLETKGFFQHGALVKQRGFMIKFEADGYAPRVSRLLRATRAMCNSMPRSNRQTRSKSLCSIPMAVRRPMRTLASWRALP